MRKFTSLLVFLLFAGGQVAFAQRTVSVRVTAAAENTPLLGVIVLVKGSTSGAVTDFDGRFAIQVTDNTTVLQWPGNRWSKKYLYEQCRPFPFLMVQCNPIRLTRTIFKTISEPDK